MVVLAVRVMDLAARVTAFDLDRRVPDREAVAQPVLEVTYDVLGVAQRNITHHHVAAQRELVAGQGPHVEVVHA